MMHIAIGSDHRGFLLKQYLIQDTFSQEIRWHDVGCYSLDICDYPIFAQKVCKLLLHESIDYGVLICGSGIGMSIAANRFRGIYAALAWNVDIARASKEDDNANILVFPADFISLQDGHDMMESWLNAVFKGGHHADRLIMIDSFGSM